MLSNSLQCETLEMVILTTAERTFVMFTGDLVFLRQDVLTFNLLVISSCSKYLAICMKSYNKKNSSAKSGTPFPSATKENPKYLTKVISRQDKVSFCNLSKSLRNLPSQRGKTTYVRIKVIWNLVEFTHHKKRNIYHS